MMRTLIVAGIALTLLGTPVEAQRRSRQTNGDAVKREREAKPPRSDDKAQNKGAQGRRNATEDAARSSQGRWNERGFLEGAGSYF